MAVKLGSGDVSFRLGSATPAAVYLGSEQVWPTVPEAPVIALALYESADTGVIFNVPANGGSAITGYKFYFDGVEVTPDAIEDSPPSSKVARFFSQDFTGQEAEISAVNELGEGPKSAPFTVIA